MAGAYEAKDALVANRHGSMSSGALPTEHAAVKLLIILRKRGCMQQDHHPQPGVSFRWLWCHLSAQWPTESSRTQKRRWTWGKQRPTPSTSCSRLIENPTSESSGATCVHSSNCCSQVRPSCTHCGLQDNCVTDQYILSIHLRIALLSATCCAGLLRRALATGS